MFFKLLLLGISITLIILVFYVLLPKTIQNYKLYRNLKLKKERQDAFRKKMNELEIK